MSLANPGYQLVYPDVFRSISERTPDRDFLTLGSDRYRSYGEIAAEVSVVAGGLAGLGVARGDTVLVMLPNGIEIVVAWLAVNHLGAVEVPLNVHDRGRFLEHVINDSQAELLIVHESLLDSVAELTGRLTSLKTVVVVGGDGSGNEPAIAGWTVVAWEQLLDAVAVDGVRVDRRDLMAILYTSGTTGPAKGIMMSYGHAAVSATPHIEVTQLTADDTYLICMPLFHSNAQVMQLLATLLVGARATILPRFDADTWLTDVRASGATVTNTLGVMCEQIYRQPVRPDDAANPLRCVQTIPAPAAIVADFESRFGVMCIDGYGLTDAAILAFRRPDEPLVPGSSGRPLDTFEMIIADPETDLPLPPRQIGEIMVRPRVPYGFMSGYWQNPSATAAAWRNLWFHTGDAGYLDEDGLLFFHDRIKDVLRVRGENVSSQLLETVICEHPAVAECAAIAVPAEAGDDEIKACVVLRADCAVTPSELLDHCLGAMPYFAVPRYVGFYDELPKTPTNKVRKAELRKSGVDATTWDRSANGYSVRARLTELRG
jgi:crotonobetaine/carnitine-CoA ligase